MDILLRPKEAQALLRISRTSFYKMCRDGRLPSVRVGKQIRVPAVPLMRVFGQMPGMSDAESDNYRK